MKIDDLSVSPYNPFRSSDNGQQIGDATIVGNANVPYAMGATAEGMTVKLWVQADHVIAGNAAQSVNATELLVKQIEEVARNPERNPSFVRWSSARSTPHDGWWHLTHASADYSWLGSMWVPMTLNFTRRAMSTAPRGVWCSGGALASTYTGTPVNLIAGPSNAQGSFTSQRATAEGGVPFILSPAANPIPFSPSQSVDDEFKARCRAFDAGSTVAANPPGGAGNPPNANWLEVLDPAHDYSGEFAMSNGLVMVSVSLANSEIALWMWDGTPRIIGDATPTNLWRRAGRIALRDGTGTEMLPRSVRVTHLSPEEVRIDINCTNGQGALTTLYIQRGQMLVGLEVRPRTFANGQPWLVTWLPANGSRALIWNEGVAGSGVNPLTGPLRAFGQGIADQGLPNNDPNILSTTATSGYAAAMIPDSTYPILVSLHSQSSPSVGQPVWPPDPPGGIYFGDAAGPVQNAMARYWIGLTPLQHPEKYIQQCEAFTVTAPWVSAADALAFGGNTLKWPTGSVIGPIANTATAFGKGQWPAGTYVVAFRYRNSGAPVNAIEVQATLSLGVPYLTFGSALGSVPAYRWFVSAPITTDGNQAPVLRLNSAGSTSSVDHFFDECAIIPITLALDNSSPQELWQQAMFLRTTDMVF